DAGRGRSSAYACAAVHGGGAPRLGEELLADRVREAPRHGRLGAMAERFVIVRYDVTQGDASGYEIATFADLDEARWAFGEARAPARRAPGVPRRVHDARLARRVVAAVPAQEARA